MTNCFLYKPLQLNCSILNGGAWSKSVHLLIDVNDVKEPACVVGGIQHGDMCLGDQSLCVLRPEHLRRWLQFLHPLQSTDVTLPLMILLHTEQYQDGPGLTSTPALTRRIWSRAAGGFCFPYQKKWCIVVGACKLTNCCGRRWPEKNSGGTGT